MTDRRIGFGGNLAGFTKSHLLNLYIQAELKFNNGSDLISWDLSEASNDNFVLSRSDVDKLTLTPSGNLTVTGDITAQGGDLFLIDSTTSVSSSVASIALRLNSNVMLDINDSTNLAVMNSDTTINGQVIVNDSSSLASIQLTNSSSGTGASNGAFIELDTIQVNFENKETGGFAFIDSSAAEIFTILDSGNVGIGTAGPLQNLHINDTTTSSFIQLTNTTSG